MDVNLPLSPPVNNNIQISLNDRLDAIVFEKIRVANTQLDTRLSLQEKIINKYRRDVEKVHAHQAQRLRREVKKIRQKKPDYVFDDSDVATSKSRLTTETGRQRCLSEPSNLSYCRRYYAHHYNVKDTSKEDKKGKEGKRSGENDFFNMRMRLYFVNMMNRALQNTHLEHDTPLEYKHSTHDMDPLENFGRSRHSQFFSRNTSIDDENDDVFSNSHSTFKSLHKSQAPNAEKNATETKISEIGEDNENVLPYLGHNEKQNETPSDSFLNWETKRGSRKHRGRRGNRRSVLGSGSEAEAEFNEAERRKSKRAFEKIFAGLL